MVGIHGAHLGGIQFLEQFIIGRQVTVESPLVGVGASG
jgi:hypothetical protein